MKPLTGTRELTDPTRFAFQKKSICSISRTVDGFSVPCLLKQGEAAGEEGLRLTIIEKSGDLLWPSFVNWQAEKAFIP